MFCVCVRVRVCDTNIDHYNHKLKYIKLPIMCV